MHTSARHISSLRKVSLLTFNTESSNETAGAVTQLHGLNLIEVMKVNHICGSTSTLLRCLDVNATRTKNTISQICVGKGFRYKGSSLSVVNWN